LKDSNEENKGLQSNTSSRGRSSRTLERRRHSGRFASPRNVRKAEVQSDVFSETLRTPDLSAATEFIASVAMASAREPEKVSKHKEHIEKLVDLFRSLARLVTSYLSEFLFDI
jgi:hypothetical protein